MKAAVLTKYRQIEWKDVPTPTINEDEALVKISYASVCGSDQHVFNGEFGLRISLPLIQGHEFAGVIEKTGTNLTGFKPGDRVSIDPIFWCGSCPACELKHYPACRSLKLLGIDVDGGFAEYVVAKDFMLFKVADSIPDTHAALVEVLSIGFHATNRANVQPGDSVAIFGAGKVGQCILQAVRTRTDGPVFMVDLLARRLQIAEQAFDNVYPINPADADPVEFIFQHTNGRGVDIAFEAVGHPTDIADRLHPLRQCIQSVRPVGTVCVLGLSDVPAPLIMKELIFKEAKIITSRVTHGEFAETLRHLKEGHLKPDVLVSGIMPVGKAQQAFEMLEDSPADHLKILLKTD